MSLRIWLPMHDGTLANQGLSDVTITNNGATVDNNGKLGKCYSFDGTSKYISLTNPIDNASEVSCSVWVKPSTNTSTNEQIMNVGTSSGWNNIRFGILQRSVNQFVFHVSDGTNYIAYSCVSGTITVDQWIHIACTYKNRELKMYLNGDLVKTYSISFDPSFSGISNIGIGAAPNGAEKFTGHISDFRVFDECLTPQIVKRLSQGLTLHYRLAGAGGENILTNTRSFTIPSGGAGLTTDTYNGFIIRHLEARSGSSYRELAYYNSFVAVESGGSYTQSFWAKGSGKLRCHFYGGNISVASNVSSQGVTTTSTDGNIEITLSSDWKRYWVTHTLNTSTDTPTNKSVLLRVFDGENEVYVCGWKLEKGSHSTPWSPAPSDPEYSTMGFYDGIEYDCSGLGNNGTKVGTITWDSNIARYNSCYAMTGTSYINCGKPYEFIPDGSDEFTVNMWAYEDAWDTSTQLCSCTESGGFSLSTGNNAVTCYCHVYRDSSILTNSSGETITNSSGDTILLSTSAQYIAFTQSYTLSSGWHMFTMVYTKEGLKIYVDGSLVRNSESSSIGLHYNKNCNLFIGAEANGSGGCTSPYLEGKASDYRLFSTALDDDSILALYNLGGSLDSNGVFHTYEYTEQ